MGTPSTAPARQSWARTPHRQCLGAVSAAAYRAGACAGKKLVQQFSTSHTSDSKHAQPQQLPPRSTLQAGVHGQHGAMPRKQKTDPPFHAPVLLHAIVQVIYKRPLLLLLLLLSGAPPWCQDVINGARSSERLDGPAGSGATPPAWARPTRAHHGLRRGVKGPRLAREPSQVSEASSSSPATRTCALWLAAPFTSPSLLN